MNRYSRQMVLSGIGKEGQEKLSHAKVTIIGMGALGTVSSNNLSRAGVGYIRMIDRDYVELTNLQRQILFNEDDAAQSIPKVIAAFNHLSKVNSDITLEPIIADVNSSNIEGFINDADLVLDATDNFEIRQLINEACHKYKIPWIYCGALGSEGMTLNILHDNKGPCLSCFLGESVSSAEQSCSAFGVLNMLTVTMASIQTAEAVKILLSSDCVRRELLSLDLWHNNFDIIKLPKNDDCPVCVHKQYKYLGVASSSYTTSLCGSDSVQIAPPTLGRVDFGIMAERLKKIGEVSVTPYILKFVDKKYEIMLFQDGRAIIKNAIDENNAKSVYTEYIGL